MTFFQAIIMGIVEGITEFLPISSTFHLIFLGQVMGLPNTDFLKVFEVFIQAGAILAALALYAQRLLTNRRLFSLVCVSFVPTAVVGFVLHKIIKTIFFESNTLMLTMFVLVGILFIGYEWWLSRHGQPEQELSALTVQQAVLVGLAQSLAVIPGVSRAGAVMVGMMMLGTKREAAAEYSFMLAVPTILAAALLDFISMRQEILAQTSALPLLLVGAGAAFVTAAVVLVGLIKYLQHHTLQGFGWYRLVMAGLLLAWLVR